MKYDSRNEVGLKGVSRDKGKFRAAITINYKQIFLGRFASAQEAKRAYEAARARRPGGDSPAGGSAGSRQ